MLFARRLLFMDEKRTYVDDAKRYIMESRENLTEKLAVYFAAYFSVFALSGIAAYVLLFLRGGELGVFTLMKPALTGGFSGVMCYIGSAASASAMTILAVFASAFTVLCKPVSAVAVIRRGLCLGSAVSFAVNGRMSIGSVPLMLYFASTLVIILISAYSGLYSKCMCRSYSCGNLSVGASVAAEYTRLTAVLSGVVFICDFIRFSAI